MASKEEINAKQTTLKMVEALELASQVSQIFVTKGKQVTHIDMRKEPPDDETLAKLLLGPTGNLRAPTLRVGKTLVVGFDQKTYENIFG